jgi:Tol biopolymer transport system component
MIKTQFLYQAMICALMLCSCSVEVEQSIATPQAGDTPVIVSTSAIPVTHVPVTWAHLNLTGKLVYLNSVMEGEELTSNIQMLDLATGEIATIFSVSPAWIYYAAISPDTKTLVISYAPPRQTGSSSVRSLYILPMDGSAEPQPLFSPSTPADRYTQAEWSPDGKHIYYVHYNQDELSQSQYFEDYDISQMTYPGDEHEQIRDHAFWPRVSTDSSRLVYVSLDPETGTNELFVANADGSNPQRVTMSGALIPEIIDAPVFVPDGQSIIFSAPEPSQAHRPNFFERMMGIEIAKAHSVPSDWWSVPVTGGVPTRLTQLQTINLFASISPDEKHIASLSGEGILVMDLDGSNLTQLLVDTRVHGTVSWIP